MNGEGHAVAAGVDFVVRRLVEAHRVEQAAQGLKTETTEVMSKSSVRPSIYTIPRRDLA